MTLLARETGAAELLFSDMELIYATKLSRAPKANTLKGAVVAAYRKPPPGQIRQGCSCLAKYCQAHEKLAEIKKSGRSHPLLSPEQDMW